MDRGDRGRRAVKEPIRKPWIWVTLTLIVLAGIPWYLPQGTVQPVFLGVPYWMFIAVISSLALCGFLSWLCLNEWDVVESARGSAGNPEGSVLAKSFARIHRRNLISQGILPLEFADETDYERLRTGDTWKIGEVREKVAAGDTGLTASSAADEIQLEARLLPREREMLLAGGLLRLLRDRS